MIGVSFVSRVLTEPLAVEEPVDSGQADIEHDRIRGTRSSITRSASITWCASRDPEPVELERRPYEIADREIIVDDKNVLPRQRGTPVRSFTLPCRPLAGFS